LEDLINEYRDVFSSGSSDVGHAKVPTVSIKLAQDEVVNLKNYRTPLKLKSVLEKLVQDLLDADIIETCSSNEFNSPCLLVPKKVDGGGDAYRLVVDYRALNKIIENVVFPIPRIQDIFTEYKGCIVFSSCDIRHAFYTIGLDFSSRHLTAFSCELGKFQFKFLPQGLKISPAVFQAQISKDLKGLERTKPYIDDILSGDPEVPRHLKNLRALFDRLRSKAYKLKLEKCHFLKKKVTHLGTDISEQGLSIPLDKLEAVRKLQRPRTQTEVKSLLGFTNFLRDKVPCYSDVVHPIQALLSAGKEKCPGGDITALWTDLHETSFLAIKEMLERPTVLAYPDSSQPYILWTDASKKAMSAVLMQKVTPCSDPARQNTVENCKPIRYWSKVFKGSQISWAPLVKEARAVYEAILHYSNIITCSKVFLRCDHKPLQNFLHARMKNDMVNRWSIAM